MKLSDVKHKIDAYFNSVSAAEIVKQFEALGYEFEDADYHPSLDYELNIISVSSISNLSISNNKMMDNDEIIVQFRDMKQTMSVEIMNLTKFLQEDSFITSNLQSNIAYAMAA